MNTDAESYLVGSPNAMGEPTEGASEAMRDNQAGGAFLVGDQWGLVQPSKGAAGPKATFACVDGDLRPKRVAGFLKRKTLETKD